jgi:hypothetical protein
VPAGRFEIVRGEMYGCRVAAELFLEILPRSLTALQQD